MLPFKKATKKYYATVKIITLYTVHIMFKPWVSTRVFVKLTLNYIYIYIVYIYARRVFCRSKIRVVATKRTRRSVRSRARNSQPTRHPSTDTRPTRKSSTCARPTGGTRVLLPRLLHRSSCTAAVRKIRPPNDRRPTDTNVSQMVLTYHIIISIQNGIEWNNYYLPEFSKSDKKYSIKVPFVSL